MTDERSGNVIHWYEEKRAVIRLTGEISNATIFSLCDEIDLAVNYYHYREIEIQIDSPGGSEGSLRYYLHKLREWQAKKATISTLAMTQACSAAALILSLGSVGRRRAYANANILYHQFHISEVSILTVDRAERMKASLQESNDFFIQTLVDHIWENQDQLPDQSSAYLQDRDLLLETYRALFALDSGKGQFLGAVEAIDFLLIDQVEQEQL